MDKPEILEYLPQTLLQELRQKADLSHLEELHLRCGRRTEAVVRRRSIMLEYRAAETDLRLLLEAATGYSFYAVQEYLREGFCTTGDGCRIGLSGTAAVDREGILVIRDIGGINIRIARQMSGVADAACDCEALYAGNY
jgi:stage III sporulation protein AA